jgi:hypothetical protein
MIDIIHLEDSFFNLVTSCCHLQNQAFKLFVGKMGKLTTDKLRDFTDVVFATIRINSHRF